MAKKEFSPKPVSPYTILNRWLYDGNYKSEIPVSLCEKSSMPQTMLLYHFISDKYLIHINKIYNNFNLWAMKLPDVFRFLKHTVKLSGFKPPYTKMYKNKSDTMIFKILRLKFPFLKKYETLMLIDEIDKSDDKNAIYEGFGLKKPIKRKNKTKVKQEKKKMVQKKESIKDSDIDDVSLDSLMENFSIN